MGPLRIPSTSESAISSSQAFDTELPGELNSIIGEDAEFTCTVHDASTKIKWATIGEAASPSIIKSGGRYVIESKECERKLKIVSVTQDDQCMISAISGKQMSICEHSIFKRVKDLVDQFEDQELGEVDIKDCNNEDLDFHSVSRNVSVKDKNGTELNNVSDQLQVKFGTIAEDEKLAEQEIRKSHEALADLEKQVNDELRASNESIR